MEIKPFKIRNCTSDQSKLIQTTLFDNGFGYNKGVVKTYKPFTTLVVNTDLEIFGGITTKWIEELEEPEITFKQFKEMYIDGKCFNPNTTKHNSCGEKYDCIQDYDNCKHYSLNQLEDGKEGFILPEKWCVKDCDIVSRWAANKFHCDNKISADKYMCISGNDYHFYFKDDISKDYVEITLEQFKKYVMKKDKVKEWSVGTYIVFLEDSIQGNCQKALTYKQIKSVKYNEDIKVDYVDGSCNNIDLSGLKNKFKWFPTEQEAKDFIKEELLKIAKEKYPVGTKVNRFGLNSGMFIVRSKPYWDLESIRVVDKRLEYPIDASSVIYYNGQWAEVILYEEVIGKEVYTTVSNTSGKDICEGQIVFDEPYGLDTINATSEDIKKAEITMKWLKESMSNVAGLIPDTVRGKKDLPIFIIPVEPKKVEEPLKIEVIKKKNLMLNI